MATYFRVFWADVLLFLMEYMGSVNNHQYIQHGVESAGENSKFPTKQSLIFMKLLYEV